MSKVFIFLFISQLSLSQIPTVKPHKGVKLWGKAKYIYISEEHPNVLSGVDFWADNTNKNLDVCIDVYLIEGDRTFGVTNTLKSNVFIEVGVSKPVGSVDAISVYNDWNLALSFDVDIEAKCKPCFSWWVEEPDPPNKYNQVYTLVIINDCPYAIDVSNCFTTTDNQILGGQRYGIHKKSRVAWSMVNYSHLNGSPVYQKSGVGNDILVPCK